MCLWVSIWQYANLASDIYIYIDRAAMPGISSPCELWLEKDITIEVQGSMEESLLTSAKDESNSQFQLCQIVWLESFDYVCKL